MDMLPAEDLPVETSPEGDEEDDEERDTEGDEEDDEERDTEGEEEGDTEGDTEDELVPSTPMPVAQTSKED